MLNDHVHIVFHMLTACGVIAVVLLHSLPSLSIQCYTHDKVVYLSGTYESVEVAAFLLYLSEHSLRRVSF